MSEIRMKVEKVYGDIITRSANDSGDCFSYNFFHHFVEEVSALVDSETKSWRDDYDRAMETTKVIGTLNDKLTRKLKARK